MNRDCATVTRWLGVLCLSALLCGRARRRLRRAGTSTRRRHRSDLRSGPWAFRPRTGGQCACLDSNLECVVDEGNTEHHAELRAMSEITAVWPLPVRLAHWLNAALVIVALAMGALMVLAVQNAATRFDLTQTHKSIGVSVLVLTLLRLGMRCFFR